MNPLNNLLGFVRCESSPRHRCARSRRSHGRGSGPGPACVMRVQRDIIRLRSILASPGDIAETTPPGVGRPRGWWHRVCRPKRLPPGCGGLAGGRRGRHDRGRPDRLGRSSLSSSTTASTSGRPGRPPRAHGEPHGAAARPIAPRHPEDVHFPPVSARGVAGTCARGRRCGSLVPVRATARVRTSLLLSRRGGA